MRLYTGTLHGRPITDWKHTDVPPGTQPHRPVLGTPVDSVTLERLRQMKAAARKVEPKKEEFRVPLVAPRPARPAEIPTSAKRLIELMADYGWESRATYYQTAVGDEACIVRGRRHDLAAIGCWERRGPKWAYVDGFTRCRSRTEQVGSEQLKTWIKQRDERCPDCGASSVAHDKGECP